MIFGQFFGQFTIFDLNFDLNCLECDSNGVGRQGRRRLPGRRDAPQTADRLRRPTASRRTRPRPNFRRQVRKFVELFGPICSNGENGGGRDEHRK